MSLRVLKLCVPLQHVSDFFVTSANAALSKSDEPEKVRTLLLPNGCSKEHATLWCACVDGCNERSMILAGQETAPDAVCIHLARSRGS